MFRIRHEGILRFAGPVGNLELGVLTGSAWTIGDGGRLDFPGVIHELRDCYVFLRGTGEIPDLASLDRLSVDSRLFLKGGAGLALNGPLTIDGNASLAGKLSRQRLSPSFEDQRRSMCN